MKLKTLRVILETMENLNMSDISVSKNRFSNATAPVWRDKYIVTGKRDNTTITMRIYDDTSGVESIIKTTEEKL